MMVETTELVIETTEMMVETTELVKEKTETEIRPVIPLLTFLFSCCNL
jgi:hypothetical protein